MIAAFLLAALLGTFQVDEPFSPDAMTPADLARSLPGLPDAAMVTVPSAVLLGDWFEVVVNGPFDEPPELSFVEPHPDLVARLPIVKRTLVGHQVSLSLTCVRPGTLALEGLVLRTADAMYTLGAPELEVTLDVPDGHFARVAEALPPVDLPLPRAPTWIFGALAVAGLGLVGWWVVGHGVERTLPVYQPPPARLALEALARLRATPPTSEATVSVFITSVSDVLRQYIEARFAVDATARTTEEFLLEALDEPALEARRETLEQFLSLCDLVKYARLRPAPGEVMPLVDTAETFVEETR